MANGCQWLVAVLSTYLMRTPRDLTKFRARGSIKGLSEELETQTNIRKLPAHQADLRTSDYVLMTFEQSTSERSAVSLNSLLEPFRSRSPFPFHRQRFPAHSPARCPYNNTCTRLVLPQHVLRPPIGETALSGSIFLSSS